MKNRECVPHITKKSQHRRGLREEASVGADSWPALSCRLLLPLQANARAARWRTVTRQGRETGSQPRTGIYPDKRRLTCSLSYTCHWSFPGVRLRQRAKTQVVLSENKGPGSRSLNTCVRLSAEPICTGSWQPLDNGFHVHCALVQASRHEPSGRGNSFMWPECREAVLGNLLSTRAIGPSVILLAT